MPDLDRLELLQISLIVHDLEATAEAFREALALRVAFRDPSVREWGLDNIVLPMGTTFIEVLSPQASKPGAQTPGGRHLERQGGDGGYMVILQTRDLAPWRAHLARTRVRIAFEAESRDTRDGQGWAGLHLHPADTGGMMISLDQPDPPDSWAGAGPDWRDFVENAVVEGLVGIELRSPDPERLASRWAEVLSRPRIPGEPMRLGQGEIGFRETRGEEREGLCAVLLRATEARRRGEEHHLAGVSFRLV